MSKEIQAEETINSEIVFEGKVVSLERATVTTGTGATATLEIVRHVPVVVMAPLDADGNLIMVQQYRKPIEQVLLELPAGGVEKGETLEQAARREMREETGYEPAELSILTTIFPTPGISDETMHLFLARDLTGDGHATEPDDELQTVRLSVPEALEMVRDGRIADAKSAVGILMLESPQST
jgi:ADP-ribose pyrophosphatase